MKPFSAFGSFLLGLIAVAHLARVIFGWTVAVDAAEIPMWPSALIFVGLGVLSILMWREARPGRAG
jgi:hypothetical protein